VRTASTEEFLLEIGRRVRERRRALGLTLRGLEDCTDLCNAFLSQVETGQSEPGAATLWRLSRALGVSIDWIVTGE
jgi:transcriptional regulator with XRE-family HTH domain